MDWWELFVQSPREDSPGKQREADSRGLVGTVCAVPWGRQPWEREGGGLLGTVCVVPWGRQPWETEGGG